MSLQRRVVEVFGANRDAIVQVYAAVPREEGRERPLLLVGTGFFVSREGHVVTNASVVYGAERLWIEHGGGTSEVQVLGHDPLSNVSVLRAEKLPPKLHFINLSESTENPEVGTFLLAITRELGLPAGPSFGMLTGRNIAYGNRQLPAVYYRSDIASDGGEGGSPVFDLQGRFVGMMIASLPEIRSSFLLPARALRRVRDDLIFSGEVKYAWFGLQASQRHVETGVEVVIDDVVEDSPAWGTGLQAGDVLLQVADAPIRNEYDLRDVSFFTPAEKWVNLRVRRGTEELEFSLRVGVRPVLKPEEAEHESPAEAASPNAAEAERPPQP